jgi:hypothetical protein
MIYHIISGDMHIQVEALTCEIALVEAFRVSITPLDKCSQFVAIFEHGKTLDDPDTKFGLTIMYLESAGYRKDEKGFYHDERPQTVKKRKHEVFERFVAKDHGRDNNVARRVNLKRTPEEWARVVQQAIYHK